MVVRIATWRSSNNTPKKVRKVGKTCRGITNSITNSLANVTNRLTDSITRIPEKPLVRLVNIPSYIPSNSSNIPSNRPHSLNSLNSLIASLASNRGRTPMAPLSWGGRGYSHEEAPVGG